MERFFRDVIGFSDLDLIEHFCNISEVIDMPKGTIIARQEEPISGIMLILKGVFRGYYLDTEGREITDCLGYRRGEPVILCSSQGAPSEITIECVTGGKCVKIAIPAFLELGNCYDEVMQRYNQFLIAGIRRHQQHKKVLHEYDAMGRYKWFLQEYPGLIDVVGHKDISSFLGITPVTLSRLRRELREQACNLRERAL